MLGSFLTRGLVMVFGYAYPAYECYKTVELNKPEIEQLRFWCQYWILVALLTVCERIGDAFVSWVSMYSEAKLAFFIYLWYPKTKGTTYVYESFLRPYVAKHETEIDRNLLELKTRVGRITALYWQKASSYGQTRIFEITQYVAAQSTASPHPSQLQRAATNLQSSAATQPLSQELSSSTTNSSSGQVQMELAQHVIPPDVASLNSPVTQTTTQRPSSSAMVNQNENTVPEETSNLGIRETLRKSLAVPSVSMAESVPLIPVEHVSFYHRFWTKR